MIPSLTIRADNAFAVPLLVTYAEACHRWAEQYPSSQLEQRAKDAERLAMKFADWQEAHPTRVKMERTLTTDNPGATVTDLRRKLRDTELALAREQRQLSQELASERTTRGRLEAEVARLQAASKQAAPVTHATMHPSTR